VGGAPTGFSVQVVNSLTGALIGAVHAAPAGATNLLVQGLTNGVAVRFEVLATNLVGNSAFSALSNAVTPLPVPPLAPPTPTAVAGDGLATLTWAAPAFGSLAGPPVTSFVIVTTPAAVGPITVTPGGTTSRTVTGLTNGTSYTFQVQAVNADGTGPLSAASAPVTPRTLAGAPTIGTPTAGAASATVPWTAPASNGGSAITGFSVRVVNAATNVQVGALRPAAAGATSLTVTGLVNGTAVRFQVLATNAAGPGPFSALSTAVTPVTVPDAPLIGVATSGNASALVRWTAPASNGGSAITGYSVRVVNATTGALIGALRPAAAGATSLTVTGLVNGTAYRFRVGASNALGLGAGSALSNTVTPATLPGAPLIGTASSGVAGGTITATARWTAPASNGGSAITGYSVRVVNATTGALVGALRPAAAGARSLTITGLVSGTAYRFRVGASNALGLGAGSALSNTVTAR
jgi:Fibronectin type III domain